MTNIKQVHIGIDEHEVTKDDPNYPITATKITFFNLGNIPVYVGMIPVMPAEIYQVNYEHPHVIRRNFKIRFDTSATPLGATDRALYNLMAGPYLVIQTMRPETEQ